MNIAENKTVLAVLFLALIASGCTGGSNQDESSSTQAIQINEFNAFPNPTPADQNTRFRMQITNLGDTDAENVYARMFNPPFATDSDQDKTWRTTSEGAVEDEDRSMAFGTLRSGDDQTPAVPKTETINLKAPALGENRDISYNFNSYLMFNYSTDATSEIQIMDGDRYREEGSPTGSASLDNSQGPIQLEIRTPTPIVLYDTAESSPTKDLCIIARNQGSGVPFNHSSAWDDDDDQWNVSKVQSQDHVNELKITASDIGSVDLTAQDDNGGQSQWVSILGGQGVGCFDMELNDISSTSIQRTVPLDFEAEYGYRQSSTASVRVEGRP